MSDHFPALILSAPPSQILAAQSQAAQYPGVSVACMGYRLGDGLRLLRAPLADAVRGGLLMIDDQDFRPGTPGSPDHFTRLMLRELSARGFTGVIANWEGAPSPPLGEMTVRLGAALSQRKLSFYVPERWGKAAPGAKVLIPSAISGGTLRGRVTEAGRAFGPERVVLAIERSAEEFVLPAEKGSGTPLSREELRQRLTGLRPRTYFSPELCAHYFTWQGRDGRARFVLFDDGSSIQRKIRLAAALDLPACLLAYPETADLLPELFREQGKP